MMYKYILRYIIGMLLLVGTFIPTVSFSAEIVVAQRIYGLASREKLDVLKGMKESLNVVDRAGNTALCQSIRNKDYKTFYVLKKAGAETQHPCVNKLSVKQIQEFNQGYGQWAKSVNSGQVVLSDGLKKGSKVEEVGLSTGAKIGLGIGTVALIGGGVALAAGGGGGGGSSGLADPCEGIVCSEAHTYCSIGECVCESGYDYYGTSACHATLKCVNGSQKADECVCRVGWTGSDCATAATCPYDTKSCANGYHESGETCQSGDTVYKKCVANSCTGYGLTSCPTGGNCSECLSGTTTKYKLDSCKSGYTQSGNTCTANTCSGSTSSVSNCKTQTTCVSPTATYYTCTACNDGYTLSGNSCSVAACTGYGLTSCPTGGNCSECLSGTTKKYKLNSCKSGYTQSGNTCTANTCSGSTSSVSNCKTQTTCVSPTATYYTCTACNDGYTLSGNSCSVAACTGYGLTSCPTGGNCSECLSGTTKKYKLDSCKSGYTQSGTSCSANSCTGYGLTSCPTGGNCSECLSGTTTKYKLDSCKSGYTQSGNSCTANSCSGSTSSVSNCKSQTTCVSPTATYYTCTACNDGYSLSGNSCSAAACTGYTLTSCPSHATCDSCLSGTTTKYKIKSCDSGYEVSGTTCVVQYSTLTSTQVQKDTHYAQGRFLQNINAAPAYAKFIKAKVDSNGKPTAYDFSSLTEVKVAVMDTGVNPNNTDINFATDSNGNIAAVYYGSYKPAYQTDAKNVKYNHGTAVAGMIASKWTNNNVNGVAPNAKIVDWMIYPANDDSANMAPSLTTTKYFDQVKAYNPRIYNMSSGFYSDYRANSSDSIFTNTSRYGSSFWKTFLQYIATSKSVFVISADNQKKTQPQLLAKAPLVSTYSSGTYNLKNLFVVSVALGLTTSDTISGLASYSSKCGVAQGYCIAAPAGISASGKSETTGHYTVSTGYNTGTTVLFNGTSASAPVTSGAIAFLMGAYPYLESQTIVEIMFRTANKNLPSWTNNGTWQDSFGNSYQTSSTYGHGVIDLGAAVTALGQLSVATTAGNADTMGDLSAIEKSPVASTQLALPQVLNSNLTVSLPGTLMALDDYNRPFDVETAGLITQAHHTDENFRRYFRSFMRRDQRTVSAIQDKMSFEFTSTITDDNLLGMGVLDIKYQLNDISSLSFSYRSDIIDEEKHFDRVLTNPFLDMKEAYSLKQSFDLTKKFTLSFGGVLGKNGFYEGDEKFNEEYNRSARAFTSEAVYKISDKISLRAIGGMLLEKEAALGMHGSGALYTEDSRTYFTGSVLEYHPIPRFSLSAAYYYGRTEIPNSKSIVSFSDITSDGFALDARYQLSDTELMGVQFSSPLRIRKGEARFNIPVARDMSSDRVYAKEVKVGLHPSAREYDVGMYYSHEHRNYDWRTEFVTRFHPEHQADLSPDYRILFGLNFKY